MSQALFRLAELAFNRPLLLEPDAAAIAASVLLPRIGAEPLVDLESHTDPEASAFVGTPVVRDGRFAGYRMAGDGVAIVPMRGKLVNRGAYLGASSGLTSYEGMQAIFSAVRGDPAVRTVIIDTDSPGGQASGAFETAAALRALADEKPVTVFVNSMCCSAAYLVGAAGGEIVLTQTGSVGSIGVLLIHLDRSGELSKAGVRPTIIHAGAGKTDGNPFEPLPEAVRADVQREIDATYGEFVAAVAGYRPARLSEAAIRETGARVMRGQAAIDAGLADRISTLDALVAQLSTQSRRPGGSQQRGSRMTATVTTEPGGDPGIPKAEHDAAVTAARAEGVAEGQKAGATAERTRLKGIMATDEAKAHPMAALALALETEATADQAKAVLLANGKPSAGLAGLMATVPNPDIGAGTPPAAVGANALKERMSKRFGN